MFYLCVYRENDVFRKNFRFVILEFFFLFLRLCYIRSLVLLYGVCLRHYKTIIDANKKSTQVNLFSYNRIWRNIYENSDKYISSTFNRRLLCSTFCILLTFFVSFIIMPEEQETLSGLSINLSSQLFNKFKWFWCQDRENMKLCT